MTTMFSNTLTAIVSALTSGTPVATQVDRVRLRPLAKTTERAVVVRPDEAEAGMAAIYPNLPVSWINAIYVECYARSSAGTAPDVAVDSLLGDVYARLMEDPTLGGVVASLEAKSIKWDFDVDGEQTACAILVFHALRTSQGATLS